MSEIIQRREEGYDVRDVEKRLLSVLEDGEDAGDGKLDSLWADLASLAPEPEFKFYEPSDLGSIKQSRPEGKHDLNCNLSPDDYYDKRVFIVRYSGDLEEKRSYELTDYDYGICNGDLQSDGTLWASPSNGYSAFFKFTPPPDW